MVFEIQERYHQVTTGRHNGPIHAIHIAILPTIELQRISEVVLAVIFGKEQDVSLVNHLFVHEMLCLKCVAALVITTKDDEP